MAWTEEELKEVREAIRKQEEMIRPKRTGLEDLFDILKIREEK